jgi:ribosomal protein RSM22 (predicted rRNA methylase)
MNLHESILENIFSANDVHSKENKQEYLHSLREELSKLRRSYRQNDIYVDYGNNSTQEAYLLGYFPHHYQVIQDIYQSEIQPQLDPLNVVCIGGGPLPELLGILKAIPLKPSQIQITIFDKFADQWQHSHRILSGIFNACAGSDCELKISQSKFDLRNKNDVFKETPVEQRYLLKNADIIIFQNFLSETDRNNDVQKNIYHLINYWADKKGTLIAFADLLGYRIKELFENIRTTLTDFDLVEFKNETVSGSIRSSEMPTDFLMNEFFAEKDSLRPRKNINFCQLVGRRR